MANEAQRWFSEGVAHLDAKRWEEALACFDWVLSVKPTNAPSWSNKSTALMKLNRFEEALASCGRALEFDPRFQDGWVNQGLVLAHLGRVEEACTSLEKAQRMGHPNAGEIIQVLREAAEKESRVGGTSDNTSQSRTLGYHHLGDFHYFTTLPEAARWLGMRESDNFQSADSFLSLVTAVHETYHVMQELLTGVCCHVAGDTDTFAIRRMDRDAVATEDSFSYKLVYSSEFTEALLEQEIRANPVIESSLRPLMDLTGQDLLECHAAILTELHMARVLKFRPEAVDRSVVDRLSPCFRVHLMGRYDLPLKMFRQVHRKFYQVRTR